MPNFVKFKKEKNPGKIYSEDLKKKIIITSFLSRKFKKKSVNFYRRIFRNSLLLLIFFGIFIFIYLMTR